MGQISSMTPSHWMQGKIHGRWIYGQILSFRLPMRLQRGFFELMKLTTSKHKLFIVLLQQKGSNTVLKP
jgi:hypothetical protein